MTSFQDSPTNLHSATHPTEVPAGFVDRRQPSPARSPGVERRQFGNSHQGLSPEARELAEAIDAYKVKHHRRFVTFEEMLQVIQSLGYHRS